MLLMLILLPAFADPQTKVNDITLDTSWAKINALPDTIKIKTLAKLCWQFRSSDPMRALTYGEEALRVIETGDYIRFKPEILSYLGVIYRNIGNLDKALNFYYQTLEVSKLINDSVQLGYSYNNLGDYYFKRASYSLALENIYKSLKIFRSLNDSSGLAYCFNNIGEINIKEGNYSEALQNLQLSADIRKRLKDDRGFSKSFSNIALVHGLLGDYKKALYYFDSMLVLNEKIKYIKGTATVLTGIGDVYYAMGDYRKSLEYLLQSQQVNEKIENTYGYIVNLNKIGLIFLALGRLTEAREKFEEAREISLKTGHLDQEMESFRNLYKLHYQSGDYKTSIKYLESYYSLYDSIFSKESLTKIADLNNDYKVAKKEFENLLLKKENEIEKTRRNYLIILSLVILAVGVLLYFRFNQKKKQVELLEQLNASKDKFFSIISHDLRSPFTVLSGYTKILEEEHETMPVEERKEMITALHQITLNILELLNGLLEWSRSQTGRIPFNPKNCNANEIISETHRLVKENLSIKEINLSVDVPNDVEIYADSDMVKTIFRNLLSNAIKFTPNGGSIWLSSEKKGNEV